MATGLEKVSFHSNPKESESEVAQSCPTLCDPMSCSLPGSSVHRIFQPIVLEWVAKASKQIKQPKREKIMGDGEELKFFFFLIN